jgi:hypothetical protein
VYTVQYLIFMRPEKYVRKRISWDENTHINTTSIMNYYY